MTAPPAEKRQTLLLVWATGATVLAAVSTGLAIFFFLNARPMAVLQTNGATASPFLELTESAIPGSYRWISKSGDESVIVLNADHTFSKGGNTNPRHRWELARDALVIVWLRSQTRLNKIERPGVYVEMLDGVETARLEKQE